MRTRVKNAWIIDGTGGPGYRGEIIIRDDVLETVSQETSEIPCDNEIDAGGLTVCPGFIDTHSHSDVVALTESVIDPKIHQGITTEVLGQDGVAMAPIPAQHSEDWRRNIGGLDGDSDQIAWQYDSIRNYFDALERAKPCSNFVCLAPHGNIRMAVMGFSNEKATEEQLQQMEELLDRQFREGAAGLSTGLIYIPCVYSDTEELVRLCRVAKKYERPFVVHQRFQNEYILDSMEELKTIVRESGVHLHISHIQVDGKDNVEMRYDLYRKMEEIEALGARVTADQYPYTAGSTMMGSIIPSWAHIGGTQKLLERLADPDARARIKDHMLHPERHKEENSIKMAGYEGIVVSSATKPENQRFVGKSIQEIGEMTGKHPIDAAMDLLLDEENRVGMIIHYTTEECIMGHMVRPEVNWCTDGLLGGKPHPRVYGAFPRLLGRYARDKKLFSLETVIQKATQKAAEAMGLHDRGVLAPGKKADMVFFDPETILDVGTFDDPRQYPTGIHRVMVNGVTVVEEDRVFSDAACGQIIRL